VENCDFHIELLAERLIERINNEFNSNSIREASTLNQLPSNSLNIQINDIANRSNDTPKSHFDKTFQFSDLNREITNGKCERIVLTDVHIEGKDVVDLLQINRRSENVTNTGLRHMINYCKLKLSADIEVNPGPAFINPANKAGLTFRGARGIFSARGPYNLPPPAGPNSEFPEIRKIKKYQYVYHDVKNCLYIKTRTYVHQFELSYNPTYSK
jgi:hypothetical protein